MAIKDIADKKITNITPDFYNREAAGDSEGTMGTLVDPDRVLSKLGLDQTTAFQDIKTDDNLEAVEGSRNAAVEKLEWDIVRDKASARVAKFIKTYYKESDFIDIPRFIGDIQQKNPYGMAPIQITWGMIDGQMIPIKLEGLPARWFTFNDDNDLRFLSKSSSFEGEEVKKHRILLARNNPTYDNPFGDKLYSKCYWPITFKRNAWKWEQVFVEKSSVPWIKGKVPASWDDTKVDELLEVISNCVQDGILIFPDGTEVDFFEPKGTRSTEIFTNLTNRMDAAVQKIWLGETLTTEITGDTGSYAAANVHQGTKDERRDKDAKEIERVNNQLIRWMVDVNFGIGIPQPKFIMNEPFSISKEQAERDAILAEKLKVGFTKDYIKSTYNLEDGDFEVVEEEEPDTGEMPADLPFTMAKKSRFRDQAAVDKMVDKLTTDETLQKQAEQLLNPIIKMVNEAENFDKVEKNLLKQWPKMKTAEAEELIASAMTIGEMTGRISASEGK